MCDPAERKSHTDKQRLLAQYTGRIALAYPLATREAIIGKMLHVSRFTVRKNKLRHPLPNDWRELKAVPTDRKVLFTLVFLTLQRLIRYYSMKKNAIPIFGSCALI